jgi:tRNA G46 methylase TrmB
MAKAFPESKFFGVDNHRESIEHAKASTEKAGLHLRLLHLQIFRVLIIMTL